MKEQSLQDMINSYTDQILRFQRQVQMANQSAYGRPAPPNTPQPKPMPMQPMQPMQPQPMQPMQPMPMMEPEFEEPAIMAMAQKPAARTTQPAGMEEMQPPPPPVLDKLPEFIAGREPIARGQTAYQVPQGMQAEVPKPPECGQNYEEFLELNPKLGYIRVMATTARGSFPVESATVEISKCFRDGKRVFANLTTDESGQTRRVELPTPSKELSDTPDGGVPYASYDIVVDHPGFDLIYDYNAPVFEGITSVQPVDLTPSVVDINRRITPPQSINTDI